MSIKTIAILLSINLGLVSCSNKASSDSECKEKNILEEYSEFNLTEDYYTASDEDGNEYRVYMDEDDNYYFFDEDGELVTESNVRKILV